jgi:hypothetical protein
MCSWKRLVIFLRPFPSDAAIVPWLVTLLAFNAAIIKYLSLLLLQVYFLGFKILLVSKLWSFA